MTAVGPITVRISDPREGSEDKPGVSGVYRNKASAEALPETYNGCATLYELFNKAVEEHENNRCARAEEQCSKLRPPLLLLASEASAEASFPPLPGRCLGWRPIAENGTAGDFEFITYKETQGGFLFVVCH